MNTVTPTGPTARKRMPGSKPRQPQRKTPKHDDRRAWLLMRLAEADGPTYDDLCREAVARFPVEHPRAEAARFMASARAVRAVRALLWDELAVTESDESVWLTPAGWREVEQAREVARRRAS